MLPLGPSADVKWRNAPGNTPTTRHTAGGIAPAGALSALSGGNSVSNAIDLQSSAGGFTRLNLGANVPLNVTQASAVPSSPPSESKYIVIGSS